MSESCLKSLRRSCSFKAVPGATLIYVIPALEIEDFPALKTTTDPGDSVTLDGDIDVVEDGFWRVLQIDPNTGATDFLYEGQGASGGWENKVSGEVSGNHAAATEFAKCLSSPCGFVMVVVKKDGTKRVLGTPDDPAFLSKWQELSGQTIKDKAYNSLEVVWSSGDPVPYYEGVLTPVDAPAEEEGGSSGGGGGG